MAVDPKRYLDLTGLQQLTANIKNRIKNAVDALDATVGSGAENSATVATGKHVAVQVVETAGKLTAITVNENDIASAATLGTPSKAAVGTEGQEGYEAPVAATGVIAQVEALEAKMGTTDVGAQITAAINDLDATEFGGQDAADSTTPSDGKHVAVKVVEADGKIYSVTVLESDIASAAFVGELPTEGVTATTVVGYAKEVADAAQAEADGRLAALEALHANKTGEGATGKQTVAEEVATGIANLRDGADAAFDTLVEIANWINDSDANKEGYNAVKHIGDIETEIGVKAAEAQGTVGEEGYVAPVAATGLYKYIDEAIADANSSADDAIKALDATVNSNSLTTATAYVAAQGTVGEEGYVAATPAAEANCKVYVKVTEEDGKLTAVQVNTTDIASAALLAQEVAKREEAIAALDANVASANLGTATAYVAAQGTVGEEGYTAATPAAEADVKVKVNVVEADGVITNVNVTTADIASAALLAQEIAKREEAIAALDADITSTDNGLCTVEVKEVDGKVTEVVVADTTSRITEDEIDTLFDVADRQARA